VRTVFENHEKTHRETTAGIVRTDKGLEQGLRELEDLRSRTDDVAAGGMTSRRFWQAVNLRFMLPFAEAVLKGGFLRRESRGAHHREDFPETDEGWAHNVLYAKNEDGSMRLWTIPGGESCRASGQSSQESAILATTTSSSRRRR
jgi:succinate dehydrogenase / fumarate reductase flavoprotein subunit